MTVDLHRVGDPLRQAGFAICFFGLPLSFYVPYATQQIMLITAWVAVILEVLGAVFYIIDLVYTDVILRPVETSEEGELNEV